MFQHDEVAETLATLPQSRGYDLNRRRGEHDSLGELAVTMAAQAGQFQINAFQPLAAHPLFQSLQLAAGVYAGV